MIIRIILAAVLALLPPVAAAQAAEAPRPMVLSPDEKILVGTIEDYLNGITTLESRFVQITARGNATRGKFYLKRPGRMRFEYDEPTPYLLVSDGTWFIYVDKELEQVTYLPLGKTPANLLLRENFSFTDGLVLIGLERAGGRIQAVVVDAEAPDAGEVTLTFNANPLTLRSWTVRDPQGQRIQVTLTEAQYGVQLDPELFRYVNQFERRRE